MNKDQKNGARSKRAWEGPGNLRYDHQGDLVLYFGAGNLPAFLKGVGRETKVRVRLELVGEEPDECCRDQIQRQELFQEVKSIVNKALSKKKELKADGDVQRPQRSVMTVREACRYRVSPDGTDAQALEHALTITERERDDAHAAVGRLKVAVADVIARAEKAETEFERLKRIIVLACGHGGLRLFYNRGKREEEAREEFHAAAKVCDLAALEAALGIEKEKNP